jgi:hypothetical protein
MAKYNENDKVGVEESNAAHRNDPSIFGFISTRPPRWCQMHHPRRASTSLESRLGNPSSTHFQAKQAARSQRVSRAVFILPLILWCNRQIIAHLVLRHKPKNCHNNFVAQITKLQLSVLRPKLGNPKPPVLRPNWEKPSTLILRPNQETHAPCLLVHSADRSWHHPTSRSSGHRIPDLCLIIPNSLHQVSYSFHDRRRCPPCHTCHLHITRQANVILHMNKYG